MLNDNEMQVVQEEVKKRLYTLNRSNELEPFLEKIGITINFSTEEVQEPKVELSSENPRGKIAIIGDSKMKINNFQGMMKEKFGLSRDYIQKHFELVLEYDGLNHYNFDKLSKYNYSVILVGPAPHSVKDKGAYSSLITKLEANDEDFYPPVYRLSQHDPISKSAIENAMTELLDDGKILFN